MAFRFRFQTVLMVKERREDERRNQLLTEEQRLQEKAKELRSWEAAHDQGIETFYEASSGMIDVDFLKQCQLHIGFLREQREVCHQELQGIHHDVEHARERLLEARKERKVMEQLKEKSRQVYVQEEQSQEQKFLDDIGISGHSRKQR